jgi:hypothetical protein
LNLDPRIVFLVLLAVTAVVFTIRRGQIFKYKDLTDMVLDFLLLPLLVGTVMSFVAILTAQDPMPMIRQLAYQASFQQLVSFDNAIPPNLAGNLKVKEITRADTDGDGSNEWVVFYRFDLKDGRSPVKAAIYDDDRGNPPVIFPYSLNVPGRDYLSEEAISIEFQPVTDDQNGPQGNNLDEIMIWGSANLDMFNELALFRFHQNSQEWEFPRDDPARYESLGFFRGDGGVSFDKSNKEVTVINRGEYERSQLALRSIYRLNPRTNSYFVAYLDSTALTTPTIQTVDFFPNPPDDILNSAFPEKIVLGFYTSVCGSADATLCHNMTDVSWQPDSFLTDDALREYQNGNPAYFGLTSFGGVQNVSVKNLRYYPALESSSAQNVVTGKQAQLNYVDLTFVVGEGGVQTRRFEVRLLEGRWKIVRQLEMGAAPAGAPVEISGQH